MRPTQMISHIFFVKGLVATKFTFKDIIRVILALQCFPVHTSYMYLHRCLQRKCHITEWAEKTVLIHFNVRYHVTIQNEFPSKFFVAEETLEFALFFGMSLFMQFQILSTRCSVLADLTFQRFDAQMHFHVRMIMGTLTKSFHANVTLIGELFDANVYPFV